MTPHHERASGRSDPDHILDQIKRHLDAFDDWHEDHATEDDIIILRCLLEAVRASRRKGYGEDLLVQVLLSLIHAPPTRS